MLDWAAMSALLRALKGALPLAAGLVLAACGGDRPPNVLLVTVDTLRADHTSLHGYDRKTTPALDAWAEGGTVFERGWSMSSWTMPSMAMLLTGQARASNAGRIFDWQDTLAQLFQARGYRTGAVVANPLINPEQGYDRGFDDYQVFEKEPGRRHQGGSGGGRRGEAIDGKFVRQGVFGAGSGAGQS